MNPLLIAVAAQGLHAFKSASQWAGVGASVYSFLQRHLEEASWEKKLPQNVAEAPKGGFPQTQS